MEKIRKIGIDEQRSKSIKELMDELENNEVDGLEIEPPEKYYKLERIYDPIVKSYLWIKVKE
jgi:hypothetical protein